MPSSCSYSLGEVRILKRSDLITDSTTDRENSAMFLVTKSMLTSLNDSTMVRTKRQQKERAYNIILNSEVLFFFLFVTVLVRKFQPYLSNQQKFIKNRSFCPYVHVSFFQFSTCIFSIYNLVYTNFNKMILLHTSTKIKF